MLGIYTWELKQYGLKELNLNDLEISGIENDKITITVDISHRLKKANENGNKFIYLPTKITKTVEEWENFFKECEEFAHYLDTKHGMYPTHFMYQGKSYGFDNMYNQFEMFHHKVDLLLRDETYRPVYRTVEQDGNFMRFPLLRPVTVERYMVKTELQSLYANDNIWKKVKKNE